ncbi:MAG TPA: 23S rRNA (uracil(1939)-C(5))-methyltransferase RlmD [Bacteroidales bacterium]|nr:MAG: 23S rRNA (uracil-C(5))-methyltransferase RlmCD [Bacteroidetes bacterium ADurb.Bin217]HPM12862.1 23S rRNA (uracil(1939)-C(5))-methyltransferase RlmD [Bacteroidales bacterium]
MGRKKKFPTLEHIQIIDIAAEGKAIAKVDDLVIFVEGAIPGDIVTLQIIKKKKKYCEARIIDFEQYSSQRTNAFCKHFGICGGCKWQILPYPLQLEYKNKQVKDQLTRIGHVQIDTILPIVAAPKTTLYRNKLEFTFSNKRWLTQQEIIEQDHIVQSNALGFHVPKLFDKIVDIETCYLQEEPSNEIRNFIKEFAHIHNYSFFDIRNHNGLLRTLMIRSTTKGQVMVIVVFYEDNSEQRTALLQAIHEQFPTIHSLLYCINQKANDTIHDQDIRVFAGTDHIIEHMENLQFKIGPKSFYQTNSEQAYTLYCIARDFAQLQGNELVYDLYTGTGTIANFIASQARKVIGIEYVPEAIDDARENSIRNNISNTLFFAGDMKDVLNDTFIETHGAPDVIITDPPRAGMHQDVIDTILRCKPNRIVYVSCNPATQARDIQLLSTQYNVHKSQAVDMFPHTHHVENVTLLVKNT